MEIHPQALRAIRQAKGLTISRVAADANIGQPHLSLIEKGERKASDAVIVALAAALNLDDIRAITYKEAVAA